MRGGRREQCEESRLPSAFEHLQDEGGASEALSLMQLAHLSLKRSVEGRFRLSEKAFRPSHIFMLSRVKNKSEHVSLSAMSTGQSP